MDTVTTTHFATGGTSSTTVNDVVKHDDEMSILMQQQDDMFTITTKDGPPSLLKPIAYQSSLNVKETINQFIVAHSLHVLSQPPNWPASRLNTNSSSLSC